MVHRLNREGFVSSGATTRVWSTDNEAKVGTRLIVERSSWRNPRPRYLQLSRATTRPRFATVLRFVYTRCEQGPAIVFLGVGYPSLIELSRTNAGSCIAEYRIRIRILRARATCSRSTGQMKLLTEIFFILSEQRNWTFIIFQYELNENVIKKSFIWLYLCNLGNFLTICILMQ